MIHYQGKKYQITQCSIYEWRKRETMSSLTSTGERVSTSTCDYRTRQAKIQKREEFIKEHGYLFCEDCQRNDCVPIDCSHDISVDQCKKMGKTELCWDVNNITLRGRKCHEKHDRLNLGS